MSIAPNTPVIVGVGFCQNKSDDANACPEPYKLMVEAVKDATSNAGNADIISQIESISVEQGMWQYKNPGKLVADECGFPNAKSILADLGVLQLNPLFDLIDEVVAGNVGLGVVTGGEAKFRELRAKIAGIEVSNTEQGEDTPAPDVYHPTPDPFATKIESDAGIFMPGELFAVIESSLRAKKGLSVEEHRDSIAELYHGFSEIASKNPHAWSQDVIPADEIRNPVGKNAMLNFPYTKKHNAQWNVNQSVAILVASYEKAKELGLNEANFIYPVSAAQSRHVNCLAEQKTFYSHLGTEMAGERAYANAGIKNTDINAADLYSCFPAAVQSFAYDLKLEEQCPLSVTGSMAFAGGPYNHGALDGVARMVEILRAGEGMSEKRYGLTSNLSGIFGKQAVAIFSNEANSNGYKFEDITEEVKAKDLPVPTSETYTGPAVVAGYTVSYFKDAIMHGFVYCDTPDGERVVAKSMDAELLDAMTKDEFVGKTVNIEDDRSFTDAA